MQSERMTRAELRAGASLSAIFGLRMLGLFFVLPVFAVHAPKYAGGGNLTLVGIALGAYGLTQAMLQIPFGAASDRWGRKPVLYAGLAIFAAGSLLAASAHDIWTAIAGRSLQGAGAISSVVMALAAIWVVAAIVPEAPPPMPVTPGRGGLAAALRPELLRLNFGIFALHSVQMAMFVVVPPMIVEAGLPLANHWMLYLPVVLVSFVLMLPPVFHADRRNRQKPVLIGAVLLLFAVQAALAAAPAGLVWLGGLMLAFFVAFNVLEAMLPSLVSRIAPPHARGAAIGVYNTTQTLGLFCGGLAGGWIAGTFGARTVFGACAGLVLAWLAVAAGMRGPTRAVNLAGA